MAIRNYIILGALAFSGCSFGGVRWNVVERTDGVVHLANLNFHDGPGTAVYSATRDAGEARLHELSLNAHREDSWLFRNGTWIDVGDSWAHDLEQRLSYIKNNLTLIRDTVRQGDEVSFYHFHPVFGSNDIKALLAAGIPTAEDYLAHFVIKNIVAQSGGNLDCSRIVSPLFTVEYELSRSFEREELELVILNSARMASNVRRGDFSDPVAWMNEYCRIAGERGFPVRIIQVHERR